MITRRYMLWLLPASLAAQTRSRIAKSKPLPSVGEFVRFADSETENLIVRLTNPASESVLPAATCRFVSVRERFLIFSSNRAGAFSPYQVDLRTGALRQLAETANLNPRLLSLDTREHSLFFIDDGRLQQLNLTSKKTETHAEGVTCFSPAGPATFIVRSGKLERLDDKKATPLADEATACLARPGGAGCLFTREANETQEFWYTGADRPVFLAGGRISNPFWAADGQSIIFLRDVPKNDVLVSEIHELPIGPDGRPSAERYVSSTTQFACFAPNGDGSVFVGASRGKAQPDIVLLLRSPRREMTLCGHHSSRAASVSPVFSPDSRRVYFESDRHGKTAVYSVNVELLVEPISTDPG